MNGISGHFIDAIDGVVLSLEAVGQREDLFCRYFRVIYPIKLSGQRRVTEGFVADIDQIEAVEDTWVAANSF